MSAPARGSVAELSPVGPLGMLDRAFSLLRGGGVAVLAPAWAGGALVAFVVLLAYYVERVEGVRSMRPLLAFLLVLAWGGRALLLGRSARRMSRALWDAPLEASAGRPVDVLRTALVAGLGLWVWCWLLVLGSLGGAIGVAFVFPLLALRGLVAPSWIARAACTSEAGFRGFFRAAGDTAGRRVAALAVELMILLGAAGLLVNLGALIVAGVVVARSFIGLEIATLSAFLSPTNVFLQIAVGAVVLVALEPLRAAVSTASYVDARVREEGLDLRAAIEDAIRHASTPRGGRGKEAARAAAVALAVLGASLLGGAVSRAQDAPIYPPPPDVLAPPSSDVEPLVVPLRPDAATDAPPIAPVVDPVDREVQHTVEEILARSEFREFEDGRGQGLRQLLERLFEWMFRPPDELPRLDVPSFANFGLPGPWFFVAIGALLLLIIVIYLMATRRREARARDQDAAASREAIDLRDRAPSTFLDEAAAFADAGRLREALRALYLATLVALDRRRLITFEPHHTNWQYLRQMPRSDAREAFRQFTRIFDHKWYGHEVTSHDDYARCRALASAIVEGPSPAEPA